MLIDNANKPFIHALVDPLTGLGFDIVECKYDATTGVLSLIAHKSPDIDLSENSDEPYFIKGDDTEKSLDPNRLYKRDDKLFVTIPFLPYTNMQLWQRQWTLIKDSFAMGVSIASFGHFDAICIEVGGGVTYLAHYAGGEPLVVAEKLMKDLKAMKQVTHEGDGDDATN